MLIFSVVIFVFSTLTLSPSTLPRKVRGHDPQLLWERRPWSFCHQMTWESDCSWLIRSAEAVSFLWISLMKPNPSVLTCRETGGTFCRTGGEGALAAVHAFRVDNLQVDLTKHRLSVRTTWSNNFVIVFAAFFLFNFPLLLVYEANPKNMAHASWVIQQWHLFILL